ncbi:transporter substrate-binding domain-containing protein, partial [Balneolaceae bacterium ANBcel3]|nr:transporter substrate-binding domain-containing protein [Balneolaceae bacterium ANBcel3]
REEVADFTHPFYISGLGIAVAYKPEGLYQAFLGLFSFEFIWVVGLLVLLLMAWGVLVWFFERKHNSEEFGGSASEGIGSGFWWAAVTMTTVGYGDKSPKTFLGRTVGFVWMFAGIILVSFFTASIASSLTVSRLDSRVNGPQDLPHVRVGTLESSATAVYLDESRIRYRSFDTIESGLQAVYSDEIDAFVHDAPIIKYYANESFYQQVRVLPHIFNEQYYGVALPAESPFRNQINKAILEYISGDEWKELRQRYLGE